MASPEDPSTSFGHVRGSHAQVPDVVDRGLRDATRHERSLWLLVLVASVADVVSTYYGLQLGFVERNLVARSAIEVGGTWSMVAVKSIVIAIAIAFRSTLPSRYTGLVPLSLAVPWVIAALINVVLLHVAV